MPLLVLACRMCPKSIEGTMYAFLMSTINFGGLISSQFGSIMTYMFNVTENNFDNLWILVVLTNTFQILPLLIISMVNTQEIDK